VGIHLLGDLAESTLPVVKKSSAALVKKFGMWDEAGSAIISSATSDDLIDPAPASLDNIQTRKWYHNQLTQIPSKLDPNDSLQQQALQAFQMRNDIKMKARILMQDQALAQTLESPKILKDIARNAYKNNYVADDFWEYMLNGSMRTNQKVDAILGVNNNFAPARKIIL
jgi:hypothetical protein